MFKYSLIIKVIFILTATLINSQNVPNSTTIVANVTATTQSTTTVPATTVSTTSLSSTSVSSTTTTTTTKATSTTQSTTTLPISQCSKNSSLCNYNGDCSNNNTCKCFNNFYGDKCEYKKCSSFENQCKHNGLCLQNIKTNEFKCECTDTAYTGALCENTLCIGYCMNNGVCDHNLITNVLKCNCLERFTGDRCQFDYCIANKTSCSSNCYLSRMDGQCKCSCGQQCNADYCNSKGSCQSLNDQLMCKCDNGYSGPNCKTDDCKGYCFNNGTCLRNESLSRVTCKCTSEYEGERCENKYVPIMPHPHRSSVFIYLIVVSILVFIIAIGTYIYKNGGTQFLQQQYENISYRLRNVYQRAPQGGSRIPYVQTRNKPNDEYTDPFQ